MSKEKEGTFKSAMDELQKDIDLLKIARLRAFTVAYVELGAKGVLIASSNGKSGERAEVFEVGGQLLVAVDFEKLVFHTKIRSKNPEEYDEARAIFVNLGKEGVQ